jgi:AcrR family transcriptional regulator
LYEYVQAKAQVMKTKMKIMKAAEELFAHAGFHHTTMRAITAKAGVNLSAVNYHFGSKKALLTAIFDEHLIPLNQERVRRLNAVARKTQETGVPPHLEEVMRCFMEPTLALFSKESGVAHFRIIVGRAFSEPNQTVRDIFLQRVMPVIDLLLDLLCQAMVHSSREEVAWKLRFALGAMSHTLSSQINQPLFNMGKIKETHEIVEMLILFIVKGMQE